MLAGNIEIMSSSFAKPPEGSGSDDRYDPVFLHARREALVILGLFSIFMVWSISWCYFGGYLAPEEQANVSILLGMPSWAFWGILLPWLAVDVVAVWFCFFFMFDDDLGEVQVGEDVAEQIGPTQIGQGQRQAEATDD